MGKQDFQHLLIILVGTYSVIGTFVPFGFYEYIGWYVTVYLVGAYIRLYGVPLVQSRRRKVLFVLGSLLLAWVSVIGVFILVRMRGGELKTPSLYYFVSDSNKILAFLPSLSLFLFFKDLKLSYCSWVNKIATATFGVLLIHDNSVAMRQWLWRCAFRNVSYSNSSYLLVHAILSVLTVYLVCVAIELLRIKYVETPLFAFIRKKSTKSVIE